MNDNTQPEALRLAEILEGDYCPDWFYEQGVDEVAAELRRQHTRIAELEAVGAGGVQALSAAPAIAKLRHLYQNMVNGAVRDTASAKRIAEGLLAPAIEALERATPPAEQQAAPKAAPGEPTDSDGFGSAEHWKEKAQYWAGVAHRLRGEALRGEPVDGIVQPPAPQQEAQEPTEISEAIERMAADRYKVVSSHESMFYGWAVVAGTGTQQLYVGREVECRNLARRFAGAFLDGAFVAMQQAAPQQEAQALSDDTKRLDWMDKDAGERVFHVGADWYTRPTYGQPYRKHKNLRAAIDAALAAQGGKT